MNKKRFLTITIIALTTLALTIYGSKSPPILAQTSSQPMQFTISGLVQNPMTVTLDDLKAMPQVTEDASLFCVDAPTIPLQQGNWTGVELSYLLQQANITLGAVKVAFFASDNFRTDLSIQMATQDNSILVAYQNNNQPLSGLRLVVPGCWGYKWINDLTQIQLVNYNFLGTEESIGYPDDATTAVIPPQPQTSISSNNQPPTFQPQNTSAPTQSILPSPTASSPTPVPTVNPTVPPVVSDSKPHVTLPFLVYVAIGSLIIAASTIASAVIFIKRKQAIT
jgi:DMSO/TMAO reductase YedYZ molybdopterin-dependent catalytic subunit